MVPINKKCWRMKHLFSLPTYSVQCVVNHFRITLFHKKQFGYYYSRCRAYLQSFTSIRLRIEGVFSISELAVNLFGIGKVLKDLTRLTKKRERQDTEKKVIYINIRYVESWQRTLFIFHSFMFFNNNNLYQRTKWRNGNKFKRNYSFPSHYPNSNWENVGMWLIN